MKIIFNLVGVSTLKIIKLLTYFDLLLVFGAAFVSSPIQIRQISIRQFR